MNYDSWLEQPFQQQCQAEEDFHEQHDELMRTTYRIDNIDNFMEALSDEILYKKKAEIEDALANRDTHQLGRIIYSEVLDWLEVMAERELTGCK
jgi:hypothetical protein